MNLFNKFKNAVKGAVTQTVRLMTPEPIKEKVVKAVRKTGTVRPLPGVATADRLL